MAQSVGTLAQGKLAEACPVIQGHHGCDEQRASEDCRRGRSLRSDGPGTHLGSLQDNMFVMKTEPWFATC